MSVHDDSFWMLEAIQLAQQAESLGEVPVGAVVVVNNKIVGKGWNQPISTNDPSAHAEIIALRNAATEINNYRIVDSTLFVTLEPCVMCVGALLHARVSRLVYGAKDPKTGAAGTVFNLLQDENHNHKVAVTSGVLDESCGELLKEFFRQRR